MTPLLGFIIILLTSFLGRAISNRFQPRLWWMKSLNYSGVHYLLLGVLAGPSVFNILNDDIVNKTSVLLGLALGWVGFLIGLQFKFKELKKFPVQNYLFSTMNYVIVLTLILGTLYLLQDYFSIIFSPSDLLVLSLSAAVSSPILIGAIRKEYHKQGAPFSLIEFSAAFDNILGIVFLGFLTTAIAQTLVLDIFMSEIIIMLGSVVISVIIGVLFKSLIAKTKNDQQYLLVLIAFIIMMVGLAVKYRISILFVSFIFGVTVTNLSISTRRLYHAISMAEKPLYFLMLIFAGAVLKFSIFPIWIVVSFFLFRILYKWLAGFVSSKALIKNKFDRPKNIGFTFVGVGGLSLALPLDYFLTANEEVAASILLIVCTVFLVNEFFAFKLGLIFCKK